MAPGPAGTGALVVRRGIVRDVLPPVGGFLAASTPYAVGRAALRPDAGRFETAGFHQPSIVGLARSAGWLGMYVGLPGLTSGPRGWRAPPRTGSWRRPASPSSRRAVRRRRWSPSGWRAGRGTRWRGGARAPGARDRALDRGPRRGRLSVAFFTTDDELRRVLDGVAEIALHTPETLPWRPAIEFLESRGSDADGRRPRPARRRPWGRTLPRALRDRPMPHPRWRGPRRPDLRIRERGWLEIRWRQFRRAPTPVVRAVLSSVGVAAVLGVLLLAYDLALDGGAALPGGDLRVLVGFVFVAAVAILGSWLTYLSGPQPGRPGVRSRWSAALGLFAALPIAYLALVILFQIVKPFLVGSAVERTWCTHAPPGVQVGMPGTRAVEYPRGVLIGRAHLRAGRHPLEDINVAADPDPYFALPSLYGAPAYARPPKVVPEAERPLDPDDLPIAAEQTDDERALAETLQASGSYRLSGGLGPIGAGYGALTGSRGSHGSHGSKRANGSNGSNGGIDGVGGRHFSLRALTDRLGPRPK